MGEFNRWQKVSDGIKSEREERLDRSKNILKFGIPFLDECTGGIVPADLILIGAKSGCGKSEMAIQIALSNAAAGKRVYVFALESDKNEVPSRIKFKKLAQCFHDDPNNRYSIERPDYLDWFLNKQEHLLGKYEDFVDAQIAEMTNLDIRYREESFGIEEYQKDVIGLKGRADLIILDHLHYIDTNGENDNLEMTNMMKIIRDLTIEYRIPVIAIAHLRKGNSDPILPSLEDFHGSSNVFRQVTKAIILGPCKDENKDRSKILTYIGVTKFRLSGGRTRDVARCAFDMKTNSYSDRYHVGTIINNGKEFKQVLTKADAPYWAKSAAFGE